ncbi:MAG: hypothetical protein RIQ79_357 [Verrucomicrobiota bacterium]|jgi:hypothetical protein
MSYDPASNSPEPVSVPSSIEELRESAPPTENLMLGVLAGVGAMLVGTTIWVTVTVLSNFQIGYMAVGVGFLVGIAMRFAGRGYGQPFHAIGAVLALLGCALGNLFTGCELIAMSNEVSFFSVVGGLDMESATGIMGAMFSPMDVLFYALAAMAGWKYSVVQSS